jgi:ribonuclease D
MVPAKQPLSPQQAAEKLEALRQWRTEEANKAQIPSYIIFSNKVLEAIVQQNPQTLGELGTIKGIGPAKLESYGKAVLAILHTNTATTDHSQKIVPPLQSVSRPTPKAQSAQLPSTFSTAGKTDDVPTIILKVISDLEGLLTPQTLTDLLTAAPNKVVPFSDHQAKGYFFGKVEEAAIDQQIRKMMTAQEIVVNRRQRLIVTKKTEE